MTNKDFVILKEAFDCGIMIVSIVFRKIKILPFGSR